MSLSHKITFAPSDVRSYDDAGRLERITVPDRETIAGAIDAAWQRLSDRSGCRMAVGEN